MSFKVLDAAERVESAQSDGPRKPEYTEETGVTGNPEADGPKGQTKVWESSAPTSHHLTNPELSASRRHWLIGLGLLAYLIMPIALLGTGLGSVSVVATLMLLFLGTFLIRKGRSYGQPSALRLNTNDRMPQPKSNARGKTASCSTAPRTSCDTGINRSGSADMAMDPGRGAAPKNAPRASSVRGPVLYGTVTGLDQRTEGKSGTSPSTTTVWTFRLQVRDETGRQTAMLPVGLRGATVIGVLADGDEVAIRTRLTSDQITWVTLLENLTTGGAVATSALRIKRRDPIAPRPNVALEAVRGTVAGVNKRMEVISLGRGGSYKIAVWSFRVFSRDAATGRDLAVPIEMRAKNEIRAALRDGDEVVIESKWRWGQTLRPHIVQSAYTGERTYIGNDPYNELLMRWILGLLWVSAVCFLLPLPMMVVTYVFIVGFFAYSLYVRAKYG